MKFAKRLLAFVVVTTVLLVGTMFANAAGAYGFVDFPTGTWSEEAMLAAVNNGLLMGKGDGSIAPEDNLTRAEAAAIINRAFGATVKTDVSKFTDVPAGVWYYEEVQKAVNMGTFVGASNTSFAPESFITRESMFTVLARALVLFDSNTSSLSEFSDGAYVSDWAKGYVSVMAKRNYVNGNGNGVLNPQGYITRQEFAQVMHNIFKVYVSQPGTIKNVTYGTTILRVPNVTLENVTIQGDLILGDGVGKGDVTLTNVKVTGRILCRGGEGKVHFVSGCTVGEMIVVHDVNGIVNFNNYRNEPIFAGINLDTQATFLGSVSINTGSSSAPSSPQEEKKTYKVEIYQQKLQGADEEAEYDLVDTLSKKANKGKTVTYTPEEITGFYVDEDASVLSGKNSGGLVLKVYYNREAYTVNFNGTDYDYLYGQILEDVQALKDAYTSALEEAILENPGYEVVIKDQSGAEIELDTQITENKTLTIVMTPIPYSITYNLDGGSVEGTLLDTYTVEDSYTIPTPTKAGHKFLGWFDEDGNEVVTVGGAVIGNLTLTASWRPYDNAEIYLVSEGVDDNGVIKVDIKINKIPDDLKDLASITLKYGYDTTKVEFVGADDAFDGVFNHSSHTLSWYSNDPITEEDLANNDYTLFTLTFNKIPTADGDAVFTITDVIMLSDSEFESTDLYETEDLTVPLTKKTYIITFDGEPYEVLAGNPLSSNDALVAAMQAAQEEDSTIKYYVNGVEIGFTYVPEADVEITFVNTPIPPEYYTVTFNGNTYDVVKGAAISTNADLVVAMQAAQEEDNTIKYYVDGVEIDFDYVPEADVEITFENTPIIIEHVVKLYSGVVKQGNYRGEYLVSNGDKLTQAQIEAVLGDPATYNTVKGYTDSDGNVHEIAPELWYNNGSEWVLFDASMPITESIDICLLTRYISFSYETDLEVKGIEIPAVTITVAYNEDTNLGETLLDALASARETFGRTFDLIEAQGMDIYQTAIDKAATKGLVDADGNILNPNVAIPLNKFITEEFISNEIDAYIDDNIGNDDFIADLISNDHVHQKLLESEGLREDLLTNTKSKDLIKEEILDNKYDPTLKADIKSALKTIVKDDKDALLEDAEILSTFTNKVSQYLNNKGITYVTAAEIVNSYKNNSLDIEYSDLYDDIIAEFETAFDEKYDSYFDTNYTDLMDEHFDKYYDDTVVAYINHNIADELKTYIDDKLIWYEEKLMADFISGADRTLLHEAIPHYAHTAVEAIKTTDAYKGPIADFVSGKDVRVNEENLVFIEILSTLMHTYDYEKLSSHVLPEKIKTAIDKLGKDVAQKYIEKYLEVFTDGMDTAIDNLNQDLNADIKGTEYTFGTKPAVRINYVEDFVVNYYNKLMPKVREKLYGQTKLDLSANPYAKELIDMDILSKYLDTGKAASEIYSGYALKDDIMEYYDVTLELAVLMHDAVVWYGNLDDAEITDKLDTVSNLIGTYANKVNEIIMHFINTGELPKGFTLDSILDKNDRVEDLYERFEDKIEKVYDIYENYLDRDYKDIIDLANLKLYADGNQYKIYQIILETSDDAFDVDNAFSAVYDKANYHGVSKFEKAMAKIKAKLDTYKYTPVANENLYIRDAYKATLDSKEVKGYNTGDHTVALQRYLRYFNN